MFDSKICCIFHTLSAAVGTRHRIPIWKLLKLADMVHCEFENVAVAEFECLKYFMEF